MERRTGMKKLFISLFAAIFAFITFALCAGAADGVTYQLNDDNGSYVLLSYTKNEAEVRIPDTYNGLPVSKIASGAFSGNISTYKIIIPESVKAIDDGAFSAMPSLYEFEAKGSYTAVDGVLYTADKKTLVRYPEARTGEFKIPNSTNVGAYAFSGCRINSLDGSGMTKAGDYAFYCSDIKTVTLSASLYSIGAHAFEKSAIYKVTVPGKTKIFAYAFSSCEDLIYADISSASVDGEGVFYADTRLLAAFVPQSLMSLPPLTFAGCTSLVTAPIGKNVTNVGSKAFYGCASLKYASCGSASYASDAFGLCGMLTPDKKTYAALSDKNAKITLKVGESYTPSSTAEYDIFTYSSNVKINGGKITAEYEGTADVFIVSRRGGDCAALEITVSDGQALSESAHPYEKGTFKYTYTVFGSPDRIAVTFSSSDMLSPADAIKIQDKKGNLYGTFYGGSLAGKTLFIDGDTVRITVISLTGGSYGFRVVSAISVSSLPAVNRITLKNSYTLKPGEQISIDPSVSPADAFPCELLYISDNNDTAYVSSDGVIHAVKEGKTQITVYSAFYGVSAKCTVTVAAQSDDFEYEIIYNRAYVTSYNGAPGVCTVPRTLGGYNVCGISGTALAYKGITELYIPRTVSNIDLHALDGNTALTAIYAAEDSTSYTTIDGALYSKDGKTLIRVPTGIKGAFTVPDGVTKVEDGAFCCCLGLEKVILGRSVTDITGAAFINCTGLKSITSVSDGFTAVDGVLYTSDKKTLVYFPASLGISTYSIISTAENIGAQAFNSAVNLKGIVLPASVKQIDGTALCDALFVTSINVNSSNKVYSASGGALYENGDLKFVPKNTAGIFTVLSSAKKILPYAFYNCSYVTNVNFPSQLSEIGEYAFGQCHSLDILYIPQTVQSVGYNAFCGDVNLYVYIPTAAKTDGLSDCTVLCGENSYAYEYCSANGVKNEPMYRYDYGIYSIYTPVRAQLRVTEQTDAVLLSKYNAAAGQNVKAFEIYLLSDGVKLPAGEYALFRQSTSSKRYYYDNGNLSEITTDAYSIYRTHTEHIIEFTGNTYSSALSVKTLPDRVTYTLYEAFDKEGMTLYYTDDKGKTTVIDDGYDVNYDFKTTGNKTVVVSYKGKTASFTVKVTESVISGTVTVTGSTKYGATLTADVSDVKPSGTALTYQWYSNGTKISGADKSSYKPDVNDIGKKITVTVRSSSGISGELTSAAVTVTKASSAAPPRPVILSSVETTVTLQTVNGCEYKLSDDKEFKDSAVFKNLTPGKTYVFCQRYKETETTEASEISSTSYTLPQVYKLNSDKYFINTANGFVSLIDPGTTVKTLKQGFKNSDKLTVYKDGVKLSDGDLAGTGCEIRIEADGKIHDKAKVIITGDVNGDGKITITDYLKIKERIQSGKALSGEKEFASDVNGDGKVTITDYLRLKYCIQNGVKPEQNRY